ncbi:glycogen/starch/alpha-glucan phosphorylase [Faunimonas sp. B44]|uniref:glycogen/starch/alpha-glucan phosphorylase n=1 Tax=Faunimonas sp. B44 TaxID=3461493 RepID=UPI004043E826
MLKRDAEIGPHTIVLPKPALRPPVREDEIEPLKEAILAKLTLAVGKNPATASPRDWYVAASLAARDRIVHRWIESNRRVRKANSKRVYYLSLEFLLGRMLGDVLNNLGLTEAFRAALGDLGMDLDQLRQAEPDAALGNGGLGRLAACFVESMATLAVPACGYGIRYDHGLFRQVIKNGVQQEYPETWLSFGNPWEFERPEVIYDIGFGGTVQPAGGSERTPRAVWQPAETVEAVAYDSPVVGWRGEHVNPLRLWSARAVDPLRLDCFNSGDHVGALTEQVRAEAISKVLYPSDATPAGQELRLRQEYFFVSASLQDLVRRHIRIYGDIRSLPEKAAIQLNDTHPSVAVAELMRLLLDVHHLTWDEAWEITRATFSYTNHTLLPEALETWPIPLFERLLPRHMQIIYLINAQHLEAVRAENPGDDRLLSSVSMIDENHGRRVKMGHLAFLGSRRVNGVSALHTALMKETVFGDLHALFPERIVNKTNGITFRRWLHQANPGLTALLRETCGEAVMDDPEAVARVAAFAADSGFHDRLSEVRLANKVALARTIRDRLDIRVNPHALFDVQVKRIHEYKRQLLNILETIALYDAIRNQPTRNWYPRVKIFAGKAAASYHEAKTIIRLAHDVASVVNDDPAVRDLLKVVFLPNYNVSLAETIIPAADLSEQISTAGMEASGTGNMKFALNGALTIGTLDGANVEIRERVGDDNIFIFGLRAHEVAERHRTGLDAMADIRNSPMLAEVLEAVAGGAFSAGDRDRYGHLVDIVKHHDRFLVAADFDGYYAAQRAVDEAWGNPRRWWKSSVLNTANMGWFSSDRTIRQYAEEIWQVPARGTAAAG